MAPEILLVHPVPGNNINSLNFKHNLEKEIENVRITQIK